MICKLVTGLFLVVSANAVYPVAPINPYSNAVVAPGPVLSNYDRGVYGGYSGVSVAPSITYGGYNRGVYGGLGYGDHYGSPAYGSGYHAYPKYQYEYGVNDPHTGDYKSQNEIRDGDVVKGSYQVADPDGTIRTVHYTADDINGFNAVVEKTPHSLHPATYAKGAYGGYGNYGAIGGYGNYGAIGGYGNHGAIGGYSNYGNLDGYGGVGGYAY